MRRPARTGGEPLVPAGRGARPLPPPPGAAKAGAPAVGGASPVTPFRQIGGFFSGLPPRDVLFFDRTYQQFFPRPLQPIITMSWQHGHALWDYVVPEQSMLVIRDMHWTVFRNDNIGVGRPIPMAPNTLTQSMGFQFEISSEWKMDLTNNNQGPGSPTVFAIGGNTGIGAIDSSVPGRIDPSGSSFADRFGPQGGWALYAPGGARLVSKYFVFRPPPVEVLSVQFRINGWAVPRLLMDWWFASGQWGLGGVPRRPPGIHGG